MYSCSLGIDLNIMNMLMKRAFISAIKHFLCISRDLQRLQLFQRQSRQRHTVLSSNSCFACRQREVKILQIVHSKNVMTVNTRLCCPYAFFAVAISIEA